MRGYFGIGVDGVSKAYNVGSVFRSAHAFGAGFVFTVAAQYERPRGHATDTSDSVGQVPFYTFPNAASLVLPEGCKLVGIELFEDSIELPSFQHPLRAAYILGAERFGLSPEVAARCDYVVKIPTRFSLNLGLAGALVMYDRVISRGRFAPRPVAEGGPAAPLAEHVHGGPTFRTMQAYRAPAPVAELAETEQLDREGRSRRPKAG
ncbi:RNA methyltransferase [Roseospira marina]|uniref:RNA methyltransferase n=1 Tax=Roseospira marina TaxID=140057 RepID=A0A5M6IF96_9PROT|nr:RNA methyltransferase [Roseospira marina]KAA5606903.1 RNA methyltransferase [Roseospira marina]MBB4312926.1 tRNA G18 (ribose-2'-O)-methylase SpoU [Roseospira marina]MBB5086301.1 tRNA G18 (ribose-2'-O)-methylase SpoU [Roseospira marina]